MSNRALDFDGLEHGLVVWVGLCEVLKENTLNLLLEFSFENMDEIFPLLFEANFDGDGFDDLQIESVHLTDLQSQRVGDFQVSFLDAFVDELGDKLIVVVVLQQNEQIDELYGRGGIEDFLFADFREKVLSKLDFEVVELRQQELHKLVEVHVGDDSPGELEVHGVERDAERELVLLPPETLLDHLVDNLLVLLVDGLGGIGLVGPNLLDVVLDALVDEHLHEVAVLLDVKVVAGVQRVVQRLLVVIKVVVDPGQQDRRQLLVRELRVVV